MNLKFPNVITCHYRCTNAMSLWDALPKCNVTNTTTEAVLVMLGGFMDSKLLQPLTNASGIMAQVADQQEAIRKRALDASELANVYKKSRAEASA